MASGGLAAASEVAVVFLTRPVVAIAFVFTLILLGTPPLPSLYRLPSCVRGFPDPLRSSPQVGTWRGGRCWCTCRWCRRSPACARRSPLDPSQPTAAASPSSIRTRPRPPRGESFTSRTTTQASSLLLFIWMFRC